MTEKATQVGQENSLGDPDDLEPDDYLDAIEGGETALYVYLKDDKKWWLAHDPKGEYEGDLNGPWLFWFTYPSGPYERRSCSRDVLRWHVEDLYYVGRDGERAHSVHELGVVPMEDAPEFVVDANSKADTN